MLYRKIDVLNNAQSEWSVFAGTLHVVQYDWKDVSADLDFILMHKSQVSLYAVRHTLNCFIKWPLMYL